MDKKKVLRSPLQGRTGESLDANREIFFYAVVSDLNVTLADTFQPLSFGAYLSLEREGSTSISGSKSESGESGVSIASLLSFDASGCCSIVEALLFSLHLTLAWRRRRVRGKPMFYISFQGNL